MNELDLEYIKNLTIPKGSFLGLNYSHTHDTSISIISPDFDIIFSSSYERLSRVKMDGAFPSELIQALPLDRFDQICLPYYESIPNDAIQTSTFHTIKRSNDLIKIDFFPEKYFEVINNISVQKKWSGHQVSHASLAYFFSGFEESIVLTYDGGAYNCPWFGGVYKANNKGLKTIDLFSSKNLAKITTMYTFITAALGFTPVKHEGKITGLAALGKYNSDCIELINLWFTQKFEQIENCFLWRNLFNPTKAPYLWVRKHKINLFIKELESFKKEDIAFAIQQITETHILKIIKKIKEDFPNLPLCLAGGLFANVKLNQKIMETLKSPIFVAPPMGDDGLSLGAILYQNWSKVKPENLIKKNMFLGPSYKKETVKSLLDNLGCIYEEEITPLQIASLLKELKTVAVFTDAMEFGPRALCNRTILANPSNQAINTTLNQKLNRTEFMPFAPVLIEQNIALYFEDPQNAKACLPFMTITLKCKDAFCRAAPAVVHVDKTARPQLVNPGHFVEKILVEFEKISGIPALINTSFNVHEEPIVCNPQDAIKGFLQAKLDFLFIEGYLLDYNKNKHILDKLNDTSKIEINLNEILHDYIDELEFETSEKEKQIQLLKNKIKEQSDHLIEFQNTLEVRQDQTEIIYQHNLQLEQDIKELLAYKGHIENHPLFKIYKKFKNGK